MNKIYYFDHSATTAVDEDVFKLMLPYFYINYGNPSSVYSIGRKNKMTIEHAREKIAKIINAKKNEIYFTSGGTESDNLALKGVISSSKNAKKHIITSKIEHNAIINSCKTLENQGVEITYLNVDNKGRINLQELENEIRPSTLMISIMMANNEIGTIQPIKEIGEIAKKRNIIFHTDAVQAVGNLKIDVKEMNIDMLSMSAHKFYGPKGIGALYVREGIEFKEIQDGGHQEKGKRAGTENVAGIVGLSEAIEKSYKNIEINNKHILNLRNYCMKEIEKNFNNIKFNGDIENKLPGNINVSFIGKDSSEILLKLDEYGICVSAGSACNTGSSNPSHVLTAIGLKSEELEGTIRISLGKENTKEEIDYLIEILSKI